MSSTVSNERKSSFLPPRLFAPPFLGLLVFATVLLWKPVAHTLAVLLSTAFPGHAGYYAGALIGLGGLVLVWRGFGKSELAATGYGYMGGALLWIGWFEYSFKFFAETLNVQPLTSGGHEIISPNLMMLETSGVILLAFLILLGANKDTRCRMFKWFHKNLKLMPETPTVAYKRQYSRITAIEIICINWFFYMVILLLFDTRLLGPTHVVSYAAFLVFIIWGLYLVTKISREKEPAFSIRYAIPTVGVLWLPIEMASSWGLYTEVWIRPLQYSVTMSLVTLVFIAGGYLILTTPRSRKTAAA